MRHRAGAILFAIILGTTGCASGTLGNIGSVLGGILGPQQQSGTVDAQVVSVSTGNAQINVLPINNGQVSSSVAALSYDNQTQVTYQGRQYPVTALERGDQIRAHITTTQSGGYYTDAIEVTQSASQTNPGGGTYGTTSYQGTVQQIDYNAGWFSVYDQSRGSLTVYMPYNARSTDVTYFQRMRTGQTVRFYAATGSDGRTILQQFY